SLLLSHNTLVASDDSPADGRADPARTAAGNGAPELRAILVTSPAPGDGKTTLVANLAAVLEETGSSVVVLDFDFRSPEVHRFFPTPQRPGLSEALRADGKGPGLDDILRSSPVVGSGVRLAPSGATDRNPSELFGPGRKLVASARRRADIVLLDTPPVL